MQIDILLEDKRWNEITFFEISEAAVTATCAHQGLMAAQVEVSLLACDDAKIAELNRDFRSKPQPTNVLSWPAQELGAALEGAAPHAPEAGPDETIALGDIAISFDTCAREAALQNKSLKAHTTHLLVHGTLHLLGYDHIHEADATLMERIEAEILGNLGFDDPY